MTLKIILFASGATLLLVSAFYGLRFYPPGYGYDEERRNNRIAFRLFVIGLATAVLPLFIDP